MVQLLGEKGRLKLGHGLVAFGRERAPTHTNTVYASDFLPLSPQYALGSPNERPRSVEHNSMTDYFDSGPYRFAMFKARVATGYDPNRVVRAADEIVSQERYIHLWLQSLVIQRGESYPESGLVAVRDRVKV